MPMRSGLSRSRTSMRRFSTATCRKRPWISVTRWWPRMHRPHAQSRVGGFRAPGCGAAGSEREMGRPASEASAVVQQLYSNRDRAARHPALQSSQPEGRCGRARGARADAWLRAQTPRDTEERTWQLLGLSWAGGDDKAFIEKAARALAALNCPTAAGTPSTGVRAMRTRRARLSSRSTMPDTSVSPIQRGGEASSIWSLIRRPMAPGTLPPVFIRRRRSVRPTLRADIRTDTISTFPPRPRATRSRRCPQLSGQADKTDAWMERRTPGRRAMG